MGKTLPAKRVYLTEELSFDDLFIQQDVSLSSAVYEEKKPLLHCGGGWASWLHLSVLWRKGLLVGHRTSSVSWCPLRPLKSLILLLIVFTGGWLLPLSVMWVTLTKQNQKYLQIYQHFINLWGQQIVQSCYIKIKVNNSGRMSLLVEFQNLWPFIWNIP